MQKYSCTICKKDSSGGSTMIHEGMFFKVCAECYEEAEILRMLDEHLKKAMETKENDV